MSIYGGPDIVTDGLVLHLDAANTKSYPGSRLIWYDLSGNNINFTLMNSPSFSTENGGCLNFNGASSQGGNNQYCVSSSNFSVPSPNITVQCFVKRNAVTSVNFPAIFFCGTGGDFTSGGGTGILVTSNNDNFYAAYYRGASGGNGISIIETNNSIVNIAITFSNNRIAYRNAASPNSLSMTSYSVSHSGLAYIGLWQTFGRYLNSKLYNFQIYNRALSASEILFNHNALKGRFGL
jgi:hypothetical protein